MTTTTIRKTSAPAAPVQVPSNDVEMTTLRNRQRDWSLSAHKITDEAAMVDHLAKGADLLVNPDGITGELVSLDQRRKALTAALKVHTAFAVTMVREGKRVGLANETIGLKVGLTKVQVGRIVAAFEVRELAKSKGLTVTAEQAQRLVNNPPKGGVQGVKDTIKRTGTLPESTSSRTKRDDAPETAKVGDVVSALSRAVDRAKVATVTADDKAAVAKVRELLTTLDTLTKGW